MSKHYDRAGFAVLITAAIIVMSFNFAFAESASRQKVVGLGAASCDQFISDATKNPSIQRDYLAWAQGYMSAILLTRPGKVDDGLDLAPPTFPLLKQLEFLRDYCRTHSDGQFPEAVEGLYKALRKELAT
ncbi:MAG TPA: hypothetical protein VFA65_20390 [Bryobacteraceae bacterium]|nr:hypothetical protein [Bryobacteraceae bacterium]